MVRGLGRGGGWGVFQSIAQSKELALYKHVVINIPLEFHKSIGSRFSAMFDLNSGILTLLHSERPKL